jgi:hypothetical protein
MSGFAKTLGLFFVTVMFIVMELEFSGTESSFQQLWLNSPICQRLELLFNVILGNHITNCLVHVSEARDNRLRAVF